MLDIYPQLPKLMENVMPNLMLEHIFFGNNPSGKHQKNALKNLHFVSHQSIQSNSHPSFTQVYYKTCDNITNGLANFPQTPTAQEVTSFRQAEGHCVSNAVNEGGLKPTYICKGDGSWDILTGSCKCVPGYEQVETSCSRK